MPAKVCALLKKARLQKGISLEEASLDLKIQPRFLEALEEGNFSDFSSAVHRTGFLKNYSAYLGLDVGQVLAFYRRDYGEAQPPLGKIKPAGVGSTLFTPEKVAFLATVLVFLFFFSYLAFSYQAYFKPPPLQVLNPASDAVVKALQIEVSGRTCRECQLRINEQEVNVSSDGYFSTTIALRSGANALSFAALNKAGRETREIRNVIVEP